MSSQIAASSYSTIFHCNQSFLVCFLRVLQGLISVAMFCLFLNGYRAFTREQHNKLSEGDKNIYMLAMGQTLLLSLYYLVAEQFFMLATIRNLLIWIAINVLHVFSQIFWREDQATLKHINYAVTVLKVANFMLWFVISLGDGSSLVNTDFNLGYNCRIIDWMIMSGLLLIVALFEIYVGYNVLEKFNWQLQTQTNDKNTVSYINKEKIGILMLMVSSGVGAGIMFIWDYLAYMLATSDASCVELFAGNNLFRNILCFLLKIVTMQVNPSVIYYTAYYSRIGDTLQGPVKELEINFLEEDAATELNCTIASRSSSRKDLFSQRELNSQYK